MKANYDWYWSVQSTGIIPGIQWMYWIFMTLIIELGIFFSDASVNTRMLQW